MLRAGHDAALGAGLPTAPFRGARRILASMVCRETCRRTACAGSGDPRTACRSLCGVGRPAHSMHGRPAHSMDLLSQFVWGRETRAQHAWETRAQHAWETRAQHGLRGDSRWHPEADGTNTPRPGGQRMAAAPREVSRGPPVPEAGLNAISDGN